ncbi:MAG: hypothetical protein JNL43_05285 [Flavobacteriales bacterium]|nr:hypothetical protein [Flavobacteriales bacterium]
MKERHVLRLVQAILLLALARYLWVAWYVHPYADDFSYAVAGMRSALGERLVQEYNSWNGRYFSNILLLRGPLTLGLSEGLSLYRLAATALILFSSFAAYRAVRALLPNAGRELCATVALVFVLLFLHVMPDPSEGVYWYTGAMTYQLPNALSLLLAASWVRSLRSPAPPSMECVIQGGLVVLIAGCNEVHMAFMVLGTAGALLYVRKHHPAMVRPTSILFGVALVCAVVVIAAPGNGTRGSHFPLRHDVLRTLGYGMAQTGRFAGKTLISLPVALLSFAFFGMRREAVRRGIIRPFDAPLDKWVALAIPFACLSVAMVVTYWPTGLLGQYRTVNMALFYFLPGWFFALAVWDQVFFAPRGKMGEGEYAIGRHWTLLVVSVCFIVQGRGMDLTWELCDGTWARYGEAMDERYRMIGQAVREGAASDLVLPVVQGPTSLNILPLDTSPDHWTNRSMADYFGNAQLNIIAPIPPAAPE